MISDKSKFELDPLGEKSVTVCRGLIHRYKNRILLALTDKCASECAFCYRKWQRGEKDNFAMNSNKEVDMVLEYLKNNKNINEVVLSGGDPLMNVELLKYALESLDECRQIKIIRIHTRLPIVKAELVTKEILTIFSKVNNSVLYISLHTNYPDELSKTVIKTINKIRKTGAILFSQSVFLRGVNDNAQVLSELFTKLLEIGVRPYNIYHCSLVKGAEHFVVPLDEEAKIMTEVKKNISGLACPTLIIDTPGTAGKIPVPLNFWQTDRSTFIDYEGNKFNGF